MNCRKLLATLALCIACSSAALADIGDKEYAAIGAAAKRPLQRSATQHGFSPGTGSYDWSADDFTFVLDFTKGRETGERLNRQLTQTFSYAPSDALGLADLTHAFSAQTVADFKAAKFVELIPSPALNASFTYYSGKRFAYVAIHGLAAMPSGKSGIGLTVLTHKAMQENRRLLTICAKTGECGE